LSVDKYGVEDLIRVARRNYEGPRKYVIVNPLQGKHLPVRPGAALGMMRALGRRIKETFPGEKLLCVGFAETATAIGAAAAEVCASRYLHTTREVLACSSVPQVEALDPPRRGRQPEAALPQAVVFSEAHSRWTEQKLCLEHWEVLLEGIERVVFIDDELSTGRTLLSLAALLRGIRAIPGGMPLAAASLISVLDAEGERRLEEAGIVPVHLVKTTNRGFEEEASRIIPDPARMLRPEDLPGAEEPSVLLEIPGRVDPRRGVSLDRYVRACGDLADRLSCALGGDLEDALGNDRSLPAGAPKKLLFLGTEECMFPGLYAAERFEKQNPGMEIYWHATTRSPIAPSGAGPIRRAFHLRSFYTPGGEAFVYNLAPYDLAVVITDSERDIPGMQEALGDLRRALAFSGTEKLTAVKWGAG